MTNLPSPLPLLTALVDPRKSERIQLPWHDLWLVVLVGLLAAPKNILDLVQWIHDRAEMFEHDFGVARVPSQATLYRFFGWVDQQQAEQVLTSWVASLLDASAATIDFSVASVDGKYLSATARKRASWKPFLTCGAYLHQHAVPAVCSLAPDGNEVASAKRALPALRSLGVELLVADAGYTGHHFAQAVRDHDLEYLFALKNNHKKTLEHVMHLCEHRIDDQAEQTARRGGETWTWTLSITTTVPAEITRGFVGTKALVKLVRLVTRHDGQERQEVAYALTSSSRSAAELLAAWRGHWGIENRVHWVRDTVFREDQCRARQAGPVLAVLRSFVLVVAQQCNESALRFTRRFAAQPATRFAALGWSPNPLPSS